MSPNVSSFVHDLVDMAKAMEALPIVQEQLRQAEDSNLKLSQAVGEREESILKLKAEIETLNDKVRKTEAERDDAELRFLESEDRMVKVSKGLAMAREALGEADRVIAPPPSPTSAPEGAFSGDAGMASGQSEGKASEPVYGTDWGQSADRPTDTTVSKVDIGNYSSVQDAQPISSVIEQPSAEGVSVQSDPTLAQSTTNVSSQNAGGGNVATQANAIGEAESEPGYRNEPSPKYSNDWYEWAYQMDSRYGAGWWPQRA